MKYSKCLPLEFSCIAIYCNNIATLLPTILLQLFYLSYTIHNSNSIDILTTLPTKYNNVLFPCPSWNETAAQRKKHEFNNCN